MPKLWHLLIYHLKVITSKRYFWKLVESNFDVSLAVIFLFQILITACLYHLHDMTWSGKLTSVVITWTLADSSCAAWSFIGTGSRVRPRNPSLAGKCGSGVPESWCLENIGNDKHIIGHHQSSLLNWVSAVRSAFNLTTHGIGRSAIELFKKKEKKDVTWGCQETMEGKNNVFYYDFVA